MKKQGINNQNNQKKNLAMKNRKSTSPFMSNSLSDPMNSLQNTNLKEKRINMINNFLIVNNYPNNFNKKDFSNMSVDFRPILKFIMEKLDPNVNLLDSLTDDKIESLAKIYEYPGKLTRSMIRDFNTPSNFLYILTFICYMVNLVSYKEYFSEKEINSIYNANNNKQENSNNNENDEKKDLYCFLNDCINGVRVIILMMFWKNIKKVLIQCAGKNLIKLTKFTLNWKKLGKKMKNWKIIYQILIQ